MRLVAACSQFNDQEVASFLEDLGAFHPAVASSFQEAFQAFQGASRACLNIETQNAHMHIREKLSNTSEQTTRLTVEHAHLAYQLPSSAVAEACLAHQLLPCLAWLGGRDQKVVRLLLKGIARNKSVGRRRGRKPY